MVECPDVPGFLLSLVAAAGTGADFSAADALGVTLATDFRFAARVVEMTLELITRGRVLPALELVDEEWRAHWRPLIDGHDRGRIEALLWSLPASFMAAGALEPGGGVGVGDLDPQAPDPVLRSFMWGLTDGLARRFEADRTDSAPPHRTRAPGAVDAWLAALVSPDGIVEANDGELAALAERVRDWQATENTDAEPVRTCFRIVPPPDDTDELAGEFGG